VPGLPPRPTCLDSFGWCIVAGVGRGRADILCIAAVQSRAVTEYEGHYGMRMVFPPVAIRKASPPDDPPRARAARERLTSRIASEHPLSSRVFEAIRDVPRHLFVDVPLEQAYVDWPLPIGWDQTISQPSIVAVMSQALELEGEERVLEIGTGSGYQTAVLSRLAAHVDSMEIVAPLAHAAEKRLQALGFANVDVREGDGYLGWLERAPYDRILLTAAPPSVPGALREQLADGGILVAPVGDRTQRLVRWRKQSDAIVEDLGPVIFVPMVKRA
jgi:protein-L-isoaspartate(D-aspartate) O-methyltransferase